MIAYRTLVCNGNGISAKIEVTLIDDIWLGPVKPPRRCLSWVGIFMLEISPCGYGSTDVVTPPLSGDLQVEILIQILIIQVCNPRKYEAIVTVNWWILDYEGCSILKISWVRAVFLIVPDVVTRHNRSVKNELRCWNKKSWLSFSSFVALRRAAAWRPKLFEFVKE